MFLNKRSKLPTVSIADAAHRANGKLFHKHATSGAKDQSPLGSVVCVEQHNGILLDVELSCVG